MWMALEESDLQIPVPASFDIRETEQLFEVIHRVEKRAVKDICNPKEQRPDINKPTFSPCDVSS